MTIISSKPKLYSTGIISVLLLLFLFSFISASSFLHLPGPPAINATLFFISRMSYWLCLGLLWLYSVKIEKQPLLIWKERKYKFSTYVLSFILVFVSLFSGLFIIQSLVSLSGFSKQSTLLNELMNILSRNKALMVFTALTAGVVEELIFRGYIQPRLEVIFKNPSAAILISSLLFGLLHYKYGTLAQVSGPVFIGAVFAFYYWKYRNIKVVIVCHFVWDLMSLLIMKAH